MRDRNYGEDAEFGAGFDWEEGAYPTPSKLVQKQVRDSSSEGKSGQVALESLDEFDSNDTELSLEKFQGVLLCVIPPHTVYVDGEETETEIGSLFLGNGQEWVRVAFWGDAAERVSEYSDPSSNPVLEVTGVMPEDIDEISDFIIFEDVEETTVKEIDKNITYRPDSASAESVKSETLVPMFEGGVVDSISDTHTNDDGEEFEVQHLALADNGDRLVVELHDSHVGREMEVGDSVFIFAGWGKDLDQFVHHRLPDYDYDGKIWVRDYSGIRNATQDPFPE